MRGKIGCILAIETGLNVYFMLFFPVEPNNVPYEVTKPYRYSQTAI